MSDGHLLDREIPWLQQGDSLLSSGADWQNNACIDFEFAHPEQRWTLCTSGYKLIADLAVEHVKMTASDQDTLVYPIFNNYRHYVELRLKDIIRNGTRLLDRGKQPRRTHKLDELWPQCREVLEAVWPDGPKEDLDTAEALILEFVALDPTGTTFRYAESDAPEAIRQIRHINLRRVGEVMAGLSSLLDGSACGVTYELQVKQEIEAEYVGY